MFIMAARRASAAAVFRTSLAGPAFAYLSAGPILIIIPVLLIMVTLKTRAGHFQVYEDEPSRVTSPNI